VYTATIARKDTLWQSAQSSSGINKHADAKIRDLTGARRDATALWALFSDSMPEMTAELLVDEQATTADILAALDRVLAQADPSDTAIVCFAGHGTRDHRIVAYDTQLTDLSATTISMETLANAFRTSPAQNILCVLDCCFSGGAPARVLEDTPIPRDIDIGPNSLSGEGRIIIAASDVDQPAYELPSDRHGLLTRALLAALQDQTRSSDILACLGQVMAHVRADSARMGVQQTPVLFGSVKGGLTLPVLRPGANFAAAFPDRTGLNISHDLAQLQEFGLPSDVIAKWQQAFPQGLNDLQLQAVNEGRVLDGESLLVVAPTTAGKTLIGELAGIRAVNDGRKAIFLFPYRALVNEKFDHFQEMYGQAIGLRVIRCSGDYADDSGAFVRGTYDIAVLTFEMFLNLIVGNPATLNQIGLIVLDEAQFIADPQRGIVVELLLTYLLTARSREITPQLVVLSAVIGGVADFDQWLGVRLLTNNKRPVPLMEGVLDRLGTYQFRLNDATNIEQFLPPQAVVVRRDRPSNQDVIVPLVRKLVAAGEKVIVFRNQRGMTEGCAAYLAAELGLPPVDDCLAALPEGDPSSSSTQLRKCLAGGTACHNTNLTREEREAVERAFRDPNSNLRVLVATTTLAAGINTPASSVILAEQEFVGEEGRPYTVAEYKNMAGRAGRLGFNETGKSFLLAESVNERNQLFARYVQATPEPIRSSFDSREIETWLIRLLAQIDRVPRPEISRLLANTYGGYLAGQANAQWNVEIQERLESLINRFLELGLLEQEQEQVRLTLLGRACGRSTLSFASSLRLVELLRRSAPEAITPSLLMALVQVLEESDGGYTPIFRRGRKESVRVSEAAQRFGQGVPASLQRFAKNEFDYFGRCKRAAILWDWISGRSITEIERAYSTTPFAGAIGHGDIRRFADATRFHLRAAHQIASVAVTANLDGDAMDILLRRLELGIPAEVVPLASLPIRLNRGTYLTLLHAGIHTPEQLWGCDYERLRQVVGTNVAERIEALRPVL